MGAGAIIQLISMLIPVIQQDGPVVVQAIHDFLTWVEGAVQSNPAAVTALKASLVQAGAKPSA